MWYCRTRSVGVGSPNPGWVPQPAGRGDLSPTMDTAPPIMPHFIAPAPEGRHVLFV